MRSLWVCRSITDSDRASMRRNELLMMVSGAGFQEVESLEEKYEFTPTPSF